MKQPIELGLIPNDSYSDYRYEVIFKAYKWDPQVGDKNTVSQHVVLMNRETAENLEAWSEELSRETVMMEEALIKSPSIKKEAKELGFSSEIISALDRLSDYDSSKHVRLMRFDFHPTETGWAVSEVNSDVPGGFPEASILPNIANRYFDKYKSGKNAADSLLNAFRHRIKNDGTVAFVHATSYSDDRQIMQFLSDHFSANGFNTLFAAPDHLKWINKKAVSVIEGKEGKIDGIVRFFPLEWLANLPKKSNWKGYYDCETVSCNHAAAIFAQSKRLPLIWDKLGIEIPAWKKFLPETKNPKDIKKDENGWIYKPALGRVGEGISIKEAISEKELKQIRKSAQRNQREWIAQKRFISHPVKAENGEEYHLCIGVFTIDGKSAGFYGRISRYPRIDASAQDIPVLVSKE